MRFQFENEIKLKLHLSIKITMHLVFPQFPINTWGHRTNRAAEFSYTDRKTKTSFSGSSGSSDVAKKTSVSAHTELTAQHSSSITTTWTQISTYQRISVFGAWTRHSNKLCGCVQKEADKLTANTTSQFQEEPFTQGGGRGRPLVLFQWLRLCFQFCVFIETLWRLWRSGGTSGSRKKRKELNCWIRDIAIA